MCYRTSIDRGLFAIGLLVCGAILPVIWAISGCAKQPYAATTTLRLTPEEQSRKSDLSVADERRIESAFQSLAAGEKAVNPPGPAPHGMRWSDLPRALDAACAEVEMAVVQATQYEWGTEFTLITIKDYPGTLTVKNIGEPGIYEAHASIGLFGDHTNQADALLAALHKSMLAFGRKREFEVDPLTVTSRNQ
jgi:hypothetical protein